MTAIIILFIIGAMLLAAEVFLPGGIAGVIGGTALLAGSILSFSTIGFTGGAIATTAALLLVAFVVYLELAVLPRTRFGRRMVVDAKVDATSQPPVADPATVLDQPAEALTTLAPSGYVLVGGRRYEAFCRSGLVDKGTRLRVTGVDNFRLIVTQP